MTFKSTGLLLYLFTVVTIVYYLFFFHVELKHFGHYRLLKDGIYQIQGIPLKGKQLQESAASIVLNNKIRPVKSQIISKGVVPPAPLLISMQFTDKDAENLPANGDLLIVTRTVLWHVFIQ